MNRELAIPASYYFFFPQSNPVYGLFLQFTIA